MAKLYVKRFRTDLLSMNFVGHSQMNWVAHGSAKSSHSELGLFQASRVVAVIELGKSDSGFMSRDLYTEG